MKEGQPHEIFKPIEYSSIPIGLGGDLVGLTYALGEDPQAMSWAIVSAFWGLIALFCAKQRAKNQEPSKFQPLTEF